MIKFLLLVVIGVVAWWIFRDYQRSLSGKAPPPPRARAAEDMVKCAQCEVNLPRSEAIYSGGEFYCTPEHQQLGKK